MFDESPFNVPADGVNMMDGTKEGMLAFFPHSHFPHR